MLDRLAQPASAAVLADENHPNPTALLPVHVRGVTLADGQRRLLDGISFTLAPATRTVVMGANGAGKSLLLKILHGLIAPHAGEVLWAGRPLDDVIRSRQALVFQKPVLLRRSARDNVAFALRHLSRADAAPRLDALLAEAGLEAVAATPARLLSGGEQQRLAIARAMAVEPGILLLDEPSASLDPAATHAVERMISAAHDRGIKIVLVTHDLGQARRMADDIVFLSAGRLAEHTPASAFFAAPRSEAARAYVSGSLYLPPEAEAG